MQDTLIYWGIHTLDRTKPNPFPLEHRIWCLQWDLVPEQLKKEIVDVLAPESLNNKRETNIGDEEWTLTLAKPDARMFKYRKYFVFHPNFDFNEYEKKLGASLRRMLPVNLSFEYFEDETAKPITKIDIYRFKTGEANPIIPFEPESVLQLGAASVRDGVVINQSDSDTISHFVGIVPFLANSSWYRSAPALTFRTQDENSELESTFPNNGEMQQVVLAIRQIYASDELFNRAVNCHGKICGDSKKVNWVAEIKRAFNTFLDSPAKGVKVRELLDTFLYGGRIVHAGEPDQQQRLQSLIKQHGRAQVIMTVQLSLRRVVDSAILVYPVLKQDYKHWIEIGKSPKPSLLSVDELLSSTKERIGRTK